MVVTVDTNVIFSALFSRSGASYRILELIFDDKLKIALSTSAYFEYYDVLTRTENLEKLKFSIGEIEDVLDLIALLAQRHSIYYLLRPNLADEKDNLFVECAFASNSEFLITSNVKDFTSGELRDFQFQVITPGNFYNLWRQKNE